MILVGRAAQVLEEACRELNKRGPGTCYALPANLSTEKECIRLAEEVGKREQHLDVLVNNGNSTTCLVFI